MYTRETREGWPLLTAETKDTESEQARLPAQVAGRWGLVKFQQSAGSHPSLVSLVETEGNGGGDMKGALPWLISWALVSPVQIIFSSPHSASLFKSPSSSILDMQLCWVACFCVSGVHYTVRSVYTVPKIRFMYSQK